MTASGACRRPNVAKPLPKGPPITPTALKELTPAEAQADENRRAGVATRARSGNKPNRLNDLSGKDWLTHSKAVMLGRLNRQALSEVKAESDALFSQAPPRDSLKKDHPATFSELPF